jgi:hypothetical protein
VGNIKLPIAPSGMESISIALIDSINIVDNPLNLSRREGVPQVVKLY